MILLLILACIQDDPAKEFEKGLPLFEAAESTRDPKKCEEVIRYYTDYRWKFDDYYSTFDAQILIGLAHQFLAEQEIDPAANWSRAIVNVAAGKSLVGKVDDVAFRSAGQEIRVRLAYGDRRKGAAAQREFETAAKIAEPLFKKSPKMRATELGKAVELETARAMCKSGWTKKGLEILYRLRAENRGTWIEDRAVDLLAEFAAVADPKIAIECADHLYEKKDFYRALSHYRRAKSSAGVAKCYIALHRYHEALAALPADALPERVGVLRRLSWIDPSFAAEYRKLAAQFPVTDIDQWLVAEGLEEDGKFLEAAAAFAKIGPESRLYDKAIFRSGLDFYRGADLKSALSTFETHLAAKNSTPEFRAKSSYYAARCCLKLGKPAAALEFAAGPESRMAAVRIEARLALGEVEKAEAEARAFVKTFESSGLGREDLQISIARIVTALEAKGLAARALDWTWEHYRIDDSDWTPAQRETFADRLLAAGKADRARDVYERVLVDRDTEILRRKFAQACARSGRPDLAITYLEDLLKDDVLEDSRNGSAWEELADAYFAKAESLSPGSERIGFLKKADRIYGSFSGRLKAGAGEDFYRLSYRHASCLSRLDPDALAEWFRQMDARGYGAPEWGGTAWKEAFETLRKELENRLPRRK